VAALFDAGHDVAVANRVLPVTWRHAGDDWECVALKFGNEVGAPFRVPPFGSKSIPLTATPGSTVRVGVKCDRGLVGFHFVDEYDYQLKPAAAPAPAGPAHGIDLWPATGSLTVHIKDNAGKNGRCTYSADWFHSLPFSLTGNGSYDLLIVPSVPEGRDWTVTVNCDNGSATTVTKFYSAPVGRKAAP
jgi:hypothetical protein